MQAEARPEACPKRAQGEAWNAGVEGVAGGAWETRNDGEGEGGARICPVARRRANFSEGNG